jgi:hypothetical protein
MNGLTCYCSLLGKDIDKLHEVREEIEKKARIKITEKHVPPKTAIQWAWKTFLSETYHPFG